LLLKAFVLGHKSVYVLKNCLNCLNKW